MTKKEKPAIYKLYDFTKCGTDIVDQMNVILHELKHCDGQP